MTMRSAADGKISSALPTEETFLALASRYHPSMVRVARAFTADPAAAEEAAARAWGRVLRDRDPTSAEVGRSLLAAVVAEGRAATASQGRPDPLRAARAPLAPAMDPGRFLPPHHLQWPRHRVDPPAGFSVDDGTSRKATLDAVDALPPAERTVAVLRDIHGWSADAVCRTLAIVARTQRALIGRACLLSMQRLESGLGIAGERATASPARGDPSQPRSSSRSSG
jgi:DNA-directed RNA polymerase specialized sigma24 family protein